MNDLRQTVMYLMLCVLAVCLFALSLGNAKTPTNGDYFERGCIKGATRLYTTSNQMNEDMKRMVPKACKQMTKQMSPKEILKMDFPEYEGCRFMVFSILTYAEMEVTLPILERFCSDLKIRIA